MSMFELPPEATAGMLEELQAVEVPDEAAPPDGAAPEAGPGQGEDASTPPEGAAPPEPPPAPEPTPAAHALNDDEWQAWETYRQLDQRLRSDAEFAARFQQVFQQPAEPPAPPPAPAPQQRPDPYADSYVTADPAYQELRAQLARQDEVIRRHEGIINAQRELETQQAINTVASSFKTRHGLDDTGYNRVYEKANQFAGVLPGLNARGVPLDQALDQVLETAYWSIPEMREAETARVAEQSRKDQQRKAKAGSLSGSSGSVPRTVEVPKDEAGRRQAMIDFIASAQGAAVE